MTNELHVVLGATGGAGHAIAEALRASGRETRAVSRRSAEHPADIETADGARTAVQGAAVVYMAAQPPYTEWSERFPAMLTHVIDATAEAGAKFVMVDNLYGYGPVSEPITETTPDLAADEKGIVRRRMTSMLMEAQRTGRVRVTIGRSSDYFGPRADNSGITALAILRATAAKKPRWLGRLDMRHSAAYLPDVARALIVLADSDRADGAIWHLPHAPALTGKEFVRLVSPGGGLAPATVSKTMLRVAAPFHAISRETLPLIHQWDRPFVVDDSKFRQTFGPFQNTPIDQAVRTTVEWYLARNREMVRAGA